MARPILCFVRNAFEMENRGSPTIHRSSIFCRKVRGTIACSIRRNSFRWNQVRDGRQVGSGMMQGGEIVQNFRGNSPWNAVMCSRSVCVDKKRTTTPSTSLLRKRMRNGWIRLCPPSVFHRFGEAENPWHPLWIRFRGKVRGATWQSGRTECLSVAHS